MQRKTVFIALFIVLPVQSYVYKGHLNDVWYPHDKSALQRKLAELTYTAQQRYNAQVNPDTIKALIVPHAGYSYSGAAAAGVYRLVNKGVVKKVIILVPDHAVAFEGVALPTFNAYQTPLGTLKVDSDVIGVLAKNPLFHREQAVFDREHSLEVQLPFIQKFFGNSCKIIPLVVGRLSCAQAQAIAHVLKPMIDDKMLVIVTTDFTHYGKQFEYTPFQDAIIYNIRHIDSQAVVALEQGNCEHFTEFMERTKATICGYYPLKILLSLKENGAFGSVEPRLIAYATSREQENADSLVPGENSGTPRPPLAKVELKSARSQRLRLTKPRLRFEAPMLAFGGNGVINNNGVVSYVGMLFTQEKLDDLPIEQQLTQQEQRGLLQEAWDILNALFDYTVDQKLLYPLQSYGVTRSHGAFTTLETKTPTGKKLRGCIGRVTTNDPLYKTVALVTRDTALRDTRFKPLEQHELPELMVKLSILSPIHAIQSYHDIVLGKHGIILKMDNKSALFLPEVPIEFKWNREQMLQELSMKAGLPATAWRDPAAHFSVFTTLDIA